MRKQLTILRAVSYTWCLTWDGLSVKLLGSLTFSTRTVLFDRLLLHGWGRTLNSARSTTLETIHPNIGFLGARKMFTQVYNIGDYPFQHWLSRSQKNVYFPPPLELQAQELSGVERTLKLMTPTPYSLLWLQCLFNVRMGSLYPSP